MLLAEDLLILLVRGSTGELPRRGTQAALAAAVVTELASTGRLIEVDDEDPHAPLRLEVVDGDPVGHPVLDDALDRVRDGGTVAEVLQAIVPGLHARLLDLLAKHGYLTPRARRRLTVTSKFVWRVAEPSRREELRVRVADVLLGRHPLNRWSAALISLLYALDAVEEVLTGHDAYVRASEIAEGGWQGDAVTEAIADAAVREVARMTLDVDVVVHGPT